MATDLEDKRDLWSIVFKILMEYDFLFCSQLDFIDQTWR